jgi:hypothetical protein
VPGGSDQAVAAWADPGSGVEISLTVTLEMVDIVESIDFLSTKFREFVAAHAH